MRFLGLLVVSSAVVLGACGGGGEKKADSAATPAPAATDTATAATAAPAAPAGPAAAITGTTIEVKMVGDEKGYRFEPADIKLKAGDGIKFVMVTGGPHNIAFDPATIPADVKPQLSANMPNQQGELSSPLLTNPNDNYIISFANVKPGTYPFHCTPHLAMGMKGTVTVQ
jgi:plastocyanin